MTEISLDQIKVQRYLNRAFQEEIVLASPFEVLEADSLFTLCKLFL